MTFKPTKTGQFKVTIRATDICGVYTDQEFIIESVQCPCEGYCRWKDAGSIEFECVCPEGCTGEQCNESLPGTRSCFHESSFIDSLWINGYHFIGNVRECSVYCVDLFWFHVHPFIWSVVEGENGEVELDVENMIVCIASCVVGVVWGILFLVCCKRKKNEKSL